MLTLKHLARDHNLDPYKLRMALRAAQLEPPENRRWKWPDANDAHYRQCLTVATKLASKTSGKST